MTILVGKLLYELLKRADFLNAGFQQDDDCPVIRVAPHSLCQFFHPVHPSILHRSVHTGMQIEVIKEAGSGARRGGETLSCAL